MADLEEEYSCKVGVDDLVLLAKLSNESISSTLTIRGQSGVIYT